MKNVEVAVPEKMLSAFTKELVEQLSLAGHDRTSEIYSLATKSFLAFNKGRDVSLNNITPELVQLYEAYLLKERGVTRNSSSFYLRVLRSIYNKAVKKGYANNCNPFAYVYTGVDRTAKRALSLNELKRLKALNLSHSKSLDVARDIFFFSFYTRGMSFVDIAFLKRSNLKNGVLVYSRRKTGQRLCIRWEKCMQELVDKYSSGEGKYLMPIIKENKPNVRRQYLNAMSKVNYGLKVISKRLNLKIPLTMYVARHSWASIARNKNIPMSVISEAMGHDSEATTQIYLASIETSVIDRANRVVIKSLFG